MKAHIVVVDPGWNTQGIIDSLRSYRKLNTCIWTTIMEGDQNQDELRRYFYPDFQIQIHGKYTELKQPSVKTFASNIIKSFRKTNDESRVDDGNRLLHTLVTGKSGSGKTALIKDLLIELHKNGFPMTIDWVGLESDIQFQLKELVNGGVPVNFHVVGHLQPSEVDAKLKQLDPTLGLVS